jgi:L-ascorbate metabolism protein UlaG (beta-lactamase superfamily)
MTTLDYFMAFEDDGLLYIGHASALVRMSGKLFLFDPTWNSRPYGEYWKMVPNQIDCSAILSKVDGCFISHIHEDHLCESILKKLNCPIYIGSDNGDRPDLRERLNGFGNGLIELPYWREHMITRDIEVLIVPHSNGVDTAFLLGNNNFTIYHGNDCFLNDVELSMFDEHVDKIDVAMVPFAFIHSYPMLCNSLTPEEKLEENGRLTMEHIRMAKKFVRKFCPSEVIPCGANLFYDDGSRHVLNKYIASPFAVHRMPALAGSHYIKPTGRGISKYVFGPESNEVWETMLSSALKNRFPAPVYTTELPCQVDKLNERLSTAKPLGFEFDIIVNGDIRVKCHEPKAYLHDSSQVDEPFIHFYVDRPICKRWLDGELTFEQVIGSRRFKYLRFPNKYNAEVFRWYMRFL